MNQIIPKPESLAKLVFLVRSEKVLLDADLAGLYDVARSYPARVGTTLVGTPSSFLKTASYGDPLAVHVTVKDWRDRSFVQAYRITREDDAQGQPELIMECEEVRIFATTRNDGKNSICAVPIPPSSRFNALLMGQGHRRLCWCQYLEKVTHHSLRHLV